MSCLGIFNRATGALLLLLPASVLFSLLHSFPSSGVSSLLFTSLGFADEDTPVLFVCLQLFHTPLRNATVVCWSGIMYNHERLLLVVPGFMIEMTDVELEL